MTRIGRVEFTKHCDRYECDIIVNGIYINAGGLDITTAVRNLFNELAFEFGSSHQWWIIPVVK